MPVIRIVLLMSVVGGLTLFAFSNLSPVLPLVFLGMKTPALPLATWVGGAIAAGAITSFFLQLLSYLQRGYSTRSLEEPGYVPPRSRPFRRENPESPAPEAEPPAPVPLCPSGKSGKPGAGTGASNPLHLAASRTAYKQRRLRLGGEE